MERGHIENYCTNFTTFRFSEIDASGSVPHSTTTLCREKKLSLHKAAGIFQTCSSAANCLSNIQSWDLNINLFKKNNKTFIFQFLEFKRSWQYLETWSLSILYVQFWGRQKKTTTRTPTSSQLFAYTFGAYSSISSLTKVAT